MQTVKMLQNTIFASKLLCFEVAKNMKFLTARFRFSSFFRDRRFGSSWIPFWFVLGRIWGVIWDLVGVDLDNEMELELPGRQGTCPGDPKSCGLAQGKVECLSVGAGSNEHTARPLLPRCLVDKWTLTRGTRF